LFKIANGIYNGLSSILDFVLKLDANYSRRTRRRWNASYAFYSWPCRFRYISHTPEACLPPTVRILRRTLPLPRRKLGQWGYPTLKTAWS